MSNSSWFVCFFPSQCIWRNKNFRKNVGYSICKVNSLQKCYEIAKFDVIRIALLKPSDGQKTYPRLLSDCRSKPSQVLILFSNRLLEKQIKY